MNLDSEVFVAPVVQWEKEISDLVNDYCRKCAEFGSLKAGVDPRLNRKRNGEMFEARSALMRKVVAMDSLQVESMWRMVETMSPVFVNSVGAMLCEAILAKLIRAEGVECRLATVDEDRFGVDLVAGMGEWPLKIQVKNNASQSPSAIKIEQNGQVVIASFSGFEKLVKFSGGVANLWVSHEMSSPLRDAAQRLVRDYVK